MGQGLIRYTAETSGLWTSSPHLITEAQIELFSQHLNFNGPFAAADHMVQKPPYWRANRAMGHLKEATKFKFSLFYVPVRNFLSSIAVFVPCHRQL